MTMTMGRTVGNRRSPVPGEGTLSAFERTPAPRVSKSLSCAGNT